MNNDEFMFVFEPYIFIEQTFDVVFTVFNNIINHTLSEDVERDFGYPKDPRQYCLNGIESLKSWMNNLSSEYIRSITEDSLVQEDDQLKQYLDYKIFVAAKTNKFEVEKLIEIFKDEAEICLTRCDNLLSSISE